MVKFYPKLKNKYSIIPHIAHTELISENPKRKPDCFTLCHLGGLGVRSPRLFLEAIRKFHSDNPSALFKVIFAGQIEPSIDDFAKKHSLADQLVQLGTVSYSDSLSLLRQSDVNVLIEAPLEKGIFFPSKVTDFIQSERPILSISPKVGFMADLLRDEKAGLAVDNSDVDSIYNAISAMYKSWEQGQLQMKFSTKQLLSEFNQNTVFHKVTSIISEVVQKK
jgi:glycosyltransferase involved in cell wall biosynthesis